MTPLMIAFPSMFKALALISYTLLPPTPPQKKEEGS